MQVLPSEVHSGYLLTEIHSSPSEYAFATEPSQLRIPVQTHSEYHLAALNPWKTATSSSAYHYVSPAELKPIVEAGRSIFGNPLSLSALKKRLNFLDSGIYRPVIVDGTLYFVASEVATVTARVSPSDSDLKQETKTAVEKLSEDVKTGRFPQSPTVSKSEVKLSLKQLRKLLGKKLFNTVLKRCKKAHNNSNLSSSDENRLEGSTAHESSSFAGNTARAPSNRSSSSVDTAHSFGVLNSCYSTRTALDPDDVKTAEYGELQVRTTNSLTSVSQKTQIDSGALSFWEKEMAEKYGLTGKENSELHLATALDSDFSMVSSASTHANDDLAKNQWDKEMEKKYQTNIEKLEPNQERSITEVGSGLVFGQTPTSFDQRASFSGRYLGEALDSNRFASLDGDVNTAKQNSKTNLHENQNVFEKTMEEIRQLQEREKERLEKQADFLSEQLEEQARQSEEQRRNDQESYKKDESLLIDVTRQNTFVQQHQFAQFQTQINNLHNSYKTQLLDTKSRWDREVSELKSRVKSQGDEIDDLKRDNTRLTNERDDAYRLANDLARELEHMKTRWFGWLPGSGNRSSSSSDPHHR